METLSKANIMRDLNPCASRKTVYRVFKTLEELGSIIQVKMRVYGMKDESLWDVIHLKMRVYGMPLVTVKGQPNPLGLSEERLEFQILLDAFNACRASQSPEGFTTGA